MGADMRGIRIQAAAITGAIVFVAAVTGSLFLTATLQNHLLDNFDTTLNTRAVDRAALIAGGATPADLTNSLVQESLVWIGTESGQTLASAGNLVLEGAPGGTTTGVKSADLQIIEADGKVEFETVRVATVAAKNPDGDIVLVSIGAEMESVNEPVSRMRFLLLLGSPALTALVMMLVWLTANRSLRSVETIRSTASRIHGDNRDERIDVPPTGDEIERLAITVNKMLDRLEADHERQQQFVGDASHELKSPIANMRAELDTIVLSDPVWPETRDHLIEQTDRLGSIISDLLVLASQDEEAEFDHETFEFDDLVIAETEAAVATTNLNVDVWDMEPALVTGNIEHLRRAVRNIVENAVRHANSTVRVEMHRRNGSVEVAISDDGDGIPEADRERVFERFARLDDARARDEGGTGLGLAIARETVERFGGSVRIGESESGGASVMLVLPAADGYRGDQDSDPTHDTAAEDHEVQAPDTEAPDVEAPAGN